MRVSDIKPFNKIKEELRNAIQEQVMAVVKPKMDEMPGWKLSILSNGYKYAMFVMFLTIIIGALMYLIRLSVISSFTKELREKIGNFEIYKKGMELTKLVIPERPAKITKSIHYSLKPFSVPDKARIIKVIPGMRGITDKQTDFISNAVTFKWEEYDPQTKQTETYYYTQAMLIVATDHFEQFEFDIKRQTFGSKIFRREKIQLENEMFEKKFSIVNNDELILRQCFTPLIQENYVYYANDVKLRDLRILKTGDEVFVLWETGENYLVIANKGWGLDGSLAGIVNGILKDILGDIGELYTSLAYVLSLPLFKPKRSASRELGSERSRKKLHRSQFLRMAKKALIASAASK